MPTNIFELGLEGQGTLKKQLLPTRGMIINGAIDDYGDTRTLLVHCNDEDSAAELYYVSVASEEDDRIDFSVDDFVCELPHEDVRRIEFEHKTLGRTVLVAEHHYLISNN